MNDVRCPRCGGTNPPESAFCGACGTSLAAQQPSAPADGPSTPGLQQPGAIQPPPQNQNSPPTVVFSPPPGAIPPPIPSPKVVSDNTKWALGLAIAALFCCGPITGVPGLFLAKKDMDEIAAGRAPHLDEGWAKAAYYLNIVALALFVFGLCVFFGMGGLRRF
jgi:hypothetical protein